LEVRLHRIADEVIELGQCGVQAAVVVEDCAGTIDVERRPELLSELREVDLFATQPAVGVASQKRCSTLPYPHAESGGG